MQLIQQTNENRSFTHNVSKEIKPWKNSQMYSSWPRRKIIFLPFSLHSSTKEGSVPRASSNLEQESGSLYLFPNFQSVESWRSDLGKASISRTFHDIVGPRRRGPVTRSLCDPSMVFLFESVRRNKERKIF